MSDIVVFLEFREDAEYFTENIVGQLTAGAFQIVVLDDDASFHLNQKGIPFTHMQDLLPPPLEGALCGEVWSRLETFCEYIDSELINRVAFLEKGVPYLAAQIDLLKIIFDGLILKVEVLRNIFSQMQPQEIYFARNDLVQPNHHRLFFDESFSLYSVLLATQLLEVAGYLPKANTWQSEYKIGSAAAKRNLSKWWYRWARAGNHIALSLRQPAIKAQSAKPTVCVIGGGDRALLAAVENLRASGSQITTWRPQTTAVPAPFGSFGARALRVVRNIAAYHWYRSKLDQVWQDLKLAPIFLSYLNWKGVDLSSIILERIHTALTDNIARQQASLKEAKRLLEKVDILISSYYSTAERPIAYLARQLSKTVVSVQHGAMGHDCGGYGWGFQADSLRTSNKNFFYTDMADADVKLTWGEAAANDMSDWRFRERHPRIEVMGAPHFSYLKGRRGKSSSPQKRILYVSNGFGNNTYMLMNLRGLAYRSKQYQILNALAAHPADHEIIYKAYSNWTRNEVYPLVRSQFARKRMIHIDSEKRLPELFEEVDCVVIDVPTTGFYEACITGLPVFLFNTACEFSDDVKDIVQRRVYYSEDMNEFCAMLDAYQTEPDRFPVLEDDAFVKAFCNIDSKPDIMTLIYGH